MDEQDRLELGDDAAWAMWAENQPSSVIDSLSVWLEWHTLARGKRMATMYGMGEILL